MVRRRGAVPQVPNYAPKLCSEFTATCPSIGEGDMVTHIRDPLWWRIRLAGLELRRTGPPDHKSIVTFICVSMVPGMLTTEHHNPGREAEPLQEMEAYTGYVTCPNPFSSQLTNQMEIRVCQLHPSRSDHCIMPPLSPLPSWCGLLMEPCEF